MIPIKDFFNSQTRPAAIANTRVQFQEHAPQMCIIGGVIGFGVATILLCRASRRADAMLDNHQARMQKLKADIKAAEEAKKPIAPEVIRHEKVSIYAETAKQAVINFGPGVLVFAASTGAVLKGANDLYARYVSTSVALAGVMSEYKSYQNYILENAGRDMHMAARGFKPETIVETVTNPETGETETVETKTYTPVGAVVEGHAYSVYAKWFDEGSRWWSKSAEFNRETLWHKQEIADNILQKRGYLYLNEVYELLDITTTLAGQEVGWIRDDPVDGHTHHVDFGTFTDPTSRARAFVNGDERNFLCDFNVDGPIKALIRDQGLLKDF